MTSERGERESVDGGRGSAIASIEAMLRVGACVVVLEPDPERSRLWTTLGRQVSLHIASCITPAAALASLISEHADALVASGFVVDEAISLVRAARALHPPAEVVLVTDDIDELRSALRSAGLYAEVLRGPATIADLFLRLGAPSTLAR